MKKSTLLSLLLSSVFVISIIANTALALDFIKHSSCSKFLVDYSDVQIPALLEEELDVECDFDSNLIHSINYFQISSNSNKSWSFCFGNEIFFLANPLKYPKSDFSSKLYLEIRNFRI